MKATAGVEERTEGAAAARVAVVGVGVVGASWASAFARAGFDVAVHDPDPAAVDRALGFVRDSARDLEALGLAPPGEADRASARVRSAASLEDALDGAGYVQESAPERLEIKKELYRRLDALAAPDTILASSSSGIPASRFTADLEGRGRCLIVHPINPTHLIPLIEIVPSPWTDPAVVDRTSALMETIGQTPIRLNSEIDGFVANRLQSAVLAEAFRLVEDGVCSTRDVDLAITRGLGRRWFFVGPFETIDLNAKDGVRGYCERLGPMYHALAKQQADPRAWSEALVAKVEAELRARTPRSELADRMAWRDRCLARLAVWRAEDWAPKDETPR